MLCFVSPRFACLVFCGPKLFLSTKVSKAIDPGTNRVRSVGCGMSQDWDVDTVCQVAAPPTICGVHSLVANFGGENIPLKLWLIKWLSRNRINHFNLAKFDVICIVSLEHDAMKSSLKLEKALFIQSIFTKLKCHFLWIPSKVCLYMGNTSTSQTPIKYFLAFLGALPTFNANNINIMITHSQTWRPLYILRAPMPLNVMAVFWRFFFVGGAKNRRAKSNFLHDINFF